jgi:hypothetical protein
MLGKSSGSMTFSGKLGDSEISHSETLLLIVILFLGPARWLGYLEGVMLINGP